MNQNLKVANAINAMKELGISPEKVKLVLEQLLEVYDKNWELIEAENYRALADSIFEEKVPETREKVSASVSSEPTLKKLCTKSGKDKASSKLDVSAKKFALEKNVTLTAGVRSSPSSQTDIMVGSVSDSRMMLHGNKRKYQNASTMKRTPEEVGTLTSNVSSTNEGHPNIGLSILPDKNSTAGSASYNRFFPTPAVDNILQFVEEQLHKLNLNKILGPQFSTSKFMDDLRGSILKLSNDSSDFTGQDGLKGTSEELLRLVSSENISNEEPGSSTSQSFGNITKTERQPVTILDDITRGKEKKKISLVDDTGKRVRPNFVYIPENLVYQGAHVNVSLARVSEDDCCATCVEDCLSLQVPCACARETGGEFAYTPGALLKEEFLNACVDMKKQPKKHNFVFCQDCPLERVKNECKPEPCKGHLVRRFIKECWFKCGCGMQCGNRIVQRGITRNLQVFWTAEGKGWGLRSTEDIPRGAFVCEYVGEILTNMELYERNLQNSGGRHTYPVYLDADWGSESILRDEEALCLDATFHGNVARFINHRCYDANLLEVPVEVETLDRHYYHLAFFTSRTVKAFEELTWDYGIDFDDWSHPIKAFRCRCGSSSCGDTRNSTAKGKRKASR